MKYGLLLSGGIDSIALCYWKRPAVTFTVDYGQRSAKGEITAAAQVAHVLALDHHIISVDCSSLGRGTMSTRDSSCLPTESIAPTEEWWPFRNQLLVTVVAGLCLEKQIDCLLMGSVATDLVHMDGSKEFFRQLDALVSAQEGNLRVDAPAISMSSMELIEQSQIPFEILAWSHSCHRGDLACGCCRGCSKHQKIFETLFPDKFGREVITEPGSSNTPR